MEEKQIHSLVFGTLAGIAVGAVGMTVAHKYIFPKKQTENRIQQQSEAELQAGQFERTIQFLGEESFAKLSRSKVIIVGLGGTGSHAAHLLARSGVGSLRLIDLDQVSLSSLNRHAVATRADVGKSKVCVMRDHLMKTVPTMNCEIVQDIFSMENGQRLIFSTDPNDLECTENFKPDFVVDCIDNVETKAFLLSLCKENNIPVVTSCGAGCRLDPSRFTICDISETHGDPLLKATKTILRKTYKIRKGIPCLFSSEKPPRKLLPFTECDENIDEYSTLPEIHMRVRIVPVLGPMPAIWGNALAMYVINTISNQVFSPHPVELHGSKYWDSMLKKANSTEIHYCATNKLKKGILNKDEAYYILEYLWNFRSAYSHERTTQKDSLTIVRWDIKKPLTIDNAIPLLMTEATAHYEQSLQWTEERKREIEQLLAHSKQ